MNPSVYEKGLWPRRAEANIRYEGRNISFEVRTRCMRREEGGLILAFSRLASAIIELLPACQGNGESGGCASAPIRMLAGVLVTCPAHSCGAATGSSVRPPAPLHTCEHTLIFAWLPARGAQLSWQNPTELRVWPCTPTSQVWFCREPLSGASPPPVQVRVPRAWPRRVIR